MARQTEPLFMQCTYDDLTFYKTGGKYYMRSKSTLTRERVKKAPEFKGTRQHNALLVSASKIASTIYNQLPKNWRQFWMYRSFTGEAMQKIGEGQSLQQTEKYLYDTYVAYWVAYQEKTGIYLQTGRTPYLKRKKPYKTRLKHFTESSTGKRANNTNGRWAKCRIKRSSPPAPIRKIRESYKWKMPQWQIHPEHSHQQLPAPIRSAHRPAINGLPIYLLLALTPRAS